MQIHTEGGCMKAHTHNYPGTSEHTVSTQEHKLTLKCMRCGTCECTYKHINLSLKWIHIYGLDSRLVPPAASLCLSLTLVHARACTCTQCPAGLVLGELLDCISGFNGQTQAVSQSAAGWTWRYNYNLWQILLLYNNGQQWHHWCPCARHTHSLDPADAT